MISTRPGLLEAVRDRFAHVDTCPFEGPRIFFENAGGALRLKSVVETSAAFASYPDNQGRDNDASRQLMAIINKGKQDMRTFFNASGGEVFVGESGTEVLFRLIRTATVGAQQGGVLIGTTLEHPATRSAMARWAEVTGRKHVLIAHDNDTGTVTAEEWRKHLTPDVRVATLIQTSPVTGMGVDVISITRLIREIAPQCLIIMDGIQHASHGMIDLDAYGIDGFAVSPYKVFSRHGYGVGWASDRLSAMPKEQIMGGAKTNWELGTRDTGAYATFSDVVDYFDWLGSQFTPSTDRRERILAAGKAIHAHEHSLTEAMLHGTGNLRGLAEMPGVTIIGGIDNPAREGLVSVVLDSMDCASLVEFLRVRGIRVHIRKADHYSGNVLEPLGLPACVRVSLCHYNSESEVAKFLAAMEEAVAATTQETGQN
ncbi:MAG: aminotransferase class V-fold PLP-dependent enzyme [Nitratireductor sp.]|nr:aminotransferase class V-fold PLP-dependent enzyme [Nitratireductor sp.]